MSYFGKNELEPGLKCTEMMAMLLLIKNSLWPDIFKKDVTRSRAKARAKFAPRLSQIIIAIFANFNGKLH